MNIFTRIFTLITLALTLNATDFLMPEEAFKPYAKVNAKMQIESGVELGKDIYVYANSVKLTLDSVDGISIKNIELPESVKHHDENVYLESPKFLINLQKNSNANTSKELTFNLSYQGCSELGLCYEPYTKKYKLRVDSSKLNNLNNESESESKVETEDKSETDTIADTLKSENIFIILLTFFGFGLLLAMTPCVFPMIPIISGLIISQGKGLTTKKAFALSLTYVISMAFAYTIAGVLAGLFGGNIQAALQTPWVIYSFSFVFVALAFSMFGFYELKLPDKFVAKISSTRNHSGFIGVSVMGFLSALIVGPCVAAPLAGALVYIGQTGDAVFGGMALFFMSIGMGIPLIIVGVSAGKFMPKPGPWMTMVTDVFGVMMLAVSIWMLEKIVNPAYIMALYGVLGLGFSLFLGALESGGHIFKRSVAMIMFVYSLSLLVGFLGGSTSMIKPLEVYKSKTISGVISNKSTVSNFTVVKSIGELDAVLQKSKGKKILLDFAADWCTACKELEEVTFSDTQVKEKMSEFVLVRADVTANTDQEKALSKKYGVFGPPALIFFDENMKVMNAKTIIGFVDAEKFLAHLSSI